VDNDDMSVKEFSPLEEFSRIYRRLWLVVLLIVIGGLVGWVFHLFKPPLYEARAIVVVDIDFAQTGKLEEIEQDQAIGAAFALLGSSPVLEQTMTDVRDQGVAFPGFLYNQNMFLERRQSQLFLRVRVENPQVAEKVTNLWVNRAYAALIDAHEHAMKAQVLRNYLAAMKECPSIPNGEPSTPSLCGSASLEEVQKNILAVETELEKETIASLGIIPALSIALSKNATLPNSPVSFGVGLLILAGALIGFFLALIIISYNIRV